MATIDRTIGNYHDSSSSRLRKEGLITGPASYTTGGDPLTAGAFGMGNIEIAIFEPFTNGTVIIFGLFVNATSVLKFFDLAGNEIANATNLSTYTARFEVIGT